jgi:hypothetical protein
MTNVALRETTCPKCGGDLATPRFMRSLIVDECDEDTACPDGEHLHWTCACGYWIPGPCADSPDASAWQAKQQPSGQAR